MGGNSSRRRRPTTNIPSYPGTPGISRPGAPVNTGLPGAGPANRDQLTLLNQQVANLQGQVQAMQRGGMGGGFPAPYGNYPIPGNMPPPMPYGTPPRMGPYPGGSPPPSPLLQHLGANPYGYPPSPMMGGGAGGSAVYRDTDFGAIAHIAGLNASDVAILHREYLSLTHGGTTKFDRSTFRSILRDVLVQANNEHVDRVIENMFVTVDRNRDGYIDFPEFVGAFKDLLKERPSDSHQMLMSNQAYPDILTEQLRASGVGSGISLEPLSYVQQPAGQLVAGGGLNMVPLASAGVQQVPIMAGGGGGAAPFQAFNASAPMLSLDPNQSSYVIATPGQYLITQPTALQCVPLPML